MEGRALLVTNSTSIGSMRRVFGFALTSFTPRSAPYPISIYATSSDGQQVFSASTEVYVLPARSYGSAVRIDTLHGGLYVQNVRTSAVQVLFVDPLFTC